MVAILVLQNCICMSKICPLWWRMDFRLGVLKSIWRNFAAPKYCPTLHFPTFSSWLGLLVFINNILLCYMRIHVCDLNCVPFACVFAVYFQFNHHKRHGFLRVLLASCWSYWLSYWRNFAWKPVAGGNVASPGTSGVHCFTRVVDILEHYLLCCQGFWKDRRIGFVYVLI